MTLKAHKLLLFGQRTRQDELRRENLPAFNFLHQRKLKLIHSSWIFASFFLILIAWKSNTRSMFRIHYLSIHNGKHIVNINSAVKEKRSLYLPASTQMDMITTRQNYSSWKDAESEKKVCMLTDNKPQVKEGYGTFHTFKVEEITRNINNVSSGGIIDYMSKEEGVNDAHSFRIVDGKSNTVTSRKTKTDYGEIDDLNKKMKRSNASRIFPKLPTNYFTRTTGNFSLPLSTSNAAVDLTQNQPIQINQHIVLQVDVTIHHHFTKLYPNDSCDNEIIFNCSRHLKKKNFTINGISREHEWVVSASDFSLEKENASSFYMEKKVHLDPYPCYNEDDREQSSKSRVVFLIPQRSFSRNESHHSSDEKKITFSTANMEYVLLISLFRISSSLERSDRTEGYSSADKDVKNEFSAFQNVKVSPKRNISMRRLVTIPGNFGWPTKKTFIAAHVNGTLIHYPIIEDTSLCQVDAELTRKNFAYLNESVLSLSLTAICGILMSCVTFIAILKKYRINDIFQTYGDVHSERGKLQSSDNFMSKEQTENVNPTFDYLVAITGSRLVSPPRCAVYTESSKSLKGTNSDRFNSEHIQEKYSKLCYKKASNDNDPRPPNLNKDMIENQDHLSPPPSVTRKRISTLFSQNSCKIFYREKNQQHYEGSSALQEIEALCSRQQNSDGAENYNSAVICPRDIQSKDAVNNLPKSPNLSQRNHSGDILASKSVIHAQIKERESSIISSNSDTHQIDRHLLDAQRETSESHDKHISSNERPKLIESNLVDYYFSPNKPKECENDAGIIVQKKSQCVGSDFFPSEELVSVSNEILNPVWEYLPSNNSSPTDKEKMPRLDFFQRENNNIMKGFEEHSTSLKKNPNHLHSQPSISNSSLKKRSTSTTVTLRSSKRRKRGRKSRNF